MYQILDATYKEDRDGPIVKLFVVDENGDHKTLWKTGFYPYFYTQADEITEELFGGNEVSHGIDVISIEQVDRYLPVGFQTKKTKLWKITLRNPIDTRVAREDVKKAPGFKEVFEADILFKNRYMIDHGLGGMSWTEDGETPVEHEGNAPLKYLALDLECLPPKSGGMPRPERDPIIICSMAFDPCYCGEETLVLMDDDEERLIKDINATFNRYNPDIVSGHNVNGFDFDYLIKRSEANRVRLRWGRDGSRILNKPDSDRPETKITGRIVVDTLPILRKTYSLRNYQLRTVAELVGMQKGDVAPGEIRRLWEAKDQRLFDYARQDSLIVLRLLRDLKILNKYIELTKLSGQMLQDTISGGQSGMIESLLIREFRKEDRVMAMKPPRCEDDDDEVKYSGAKVIEPKKGLTEHVITLDFTSLYPTIMISRNLCYSTIVLDPSYKSDKVIVTPSGAKFVTTDVKRGIVPRILEMLFNERVRTKRLMKIVEGSEKDVLDAKQYGIKILLNSFYGYAGYTKSRLWVQQVAESVTAFGRDNLLATKAFLETTYNVEVVGGDTDSLFISVGDRGQYKNFKALGEEMAAAVTARLPPPMSLSFENYMRRLLVLAKKRYSGAVVSEDGSVKLKTKGLETVRRDWCPLTSDMLSDILNKIVKEGDVEGAVKRAQTAVHAIEDLTDQCVRGHLDKESLTPLILTRRYRGDGEHKQTLAHDEVAKRCKIRGVKEYATGDRVEMVVVVGGGSGIMSDSHIKSDMMRDRAEDPDYVLDNKLMLDGSYYLNRQILPPALRMLEPFGVTKDVIVGRKKFEKSKPKKSMKQLSWLEIWGFDDEKT